MEHYRYYCTVKLNNVEDRLNIYNSDPGDATMWYGGICEVMEIFGGTVSNLMGEPVTQDQILEEFRKEESDAKLSFCLATGMTRRDAGSVTVSFKPSVKEIVSSENPVDENNNSPLRFPE
jgi:hypothetical protein